MATRTAPGTDGLDRPSSGGRRSTESWTIGEVARLAGVTTRTLRHYDAVGLLRPTGVAAGGRRLYGRPELLRLQQILVLRELGVGLSTVAQIFADGGTGGGTGGGTSGPGVRRELLREHHARLIAERDRFDRLARTVEATLQSWEEGTDMAPGDLYAGFDHSRYEAEARERYGDDAVDTGNASWQRLGAEGQARLADEHTAIAAGLADLLRDGVGVRDERVQALVARHHRWVSTFWTPDADAYLGLGRMYVDDERFAATYDGVAAGLAAYLRDAIAVHAEANLR